ncbi:MAG: efflux RND transporter periplasmic adaptor subunit [Pseudomonadota bacterium]
MTEPTAAPATPAPTTRGRLWIVLAILLAVIAIPVLSRQGEGRASPVQIEPAALRPLRTAILASGSLAHEEEVTLTAEVIGRVEAVYVEEGDRVSAGALVLKIDDEALAAQVAQSQASVRLQEIEIERAALQLKNLERARDRAAQLRKRKLLDEGTYDDAQLAFEIAAVELRAARERLVQTQAALQQFQDQRSKTEVLAPIDGVVTSLDIEVGETAVSSTTNIPGSGLMTISDPSNIITEVHVDEADVADIALGQSAEIVAVAYPDRPLTGVVRFIANTAKADNHSQGLSFLVRIAITDSNGIALRPGMSCRAAIYTASEEALLSVPVQAIIATEDSQSRRLRSHLFAVRDGRAVKVPVTTGLSDDAFQQVSGALEAEDAIITGPARTLRRLRDGDPVRPEGR